ncbi:hypothetical protein Tco_0672184 [Tanacetum coccineum]
MHQPWRTFAALINKSLSGKTSGLDKLRLSRAQIIWSMYFQKNVDYVELLWEDFTYQIDNKDFKKQEKMYYPRFTKVIIHHFLIKEKTLSWRNKIGMHTSKDDYLINTLRFVSRKEASQIYGAVLPEYQVPVDEERYHQRQTNHRFWSRSLQLSQQQLLSEVALTEKAQLKEVRKKSLRDFHKTHPSSSGTVTKKPPSVEKITPTITSEGTGDEPGFPCEEDDFVLRDIPYTDAEIVSPFDVPVQHEVPNTQTTTLLPIPVSVITTIPQSLQTFTPPPLVSTPIPPPTTEATNPSTTLPDFALDPLHTQVTSLVDEHLDTRLGETKEEFINFLSESLTARIKEQVKDQLPQILPKEVSNFTPPLIKKLIKESRDEVTLAKDKDEDPSAGSDRGLKKRKTSKDAEPTTGQKKKDSTSGSSKGTKSQSKSSEKSVQSEEPVFEVADSDMLQDQEGNMGDNEDKPRKETASRRDWFKKPTPPQEPTDPDWNIGKTTQEGPTQNWLMTLAASTSTDKSLKDFDELMSTPIDFSGYILNGLKIENLTQEILLGPAFRLLKGTRSNYGLIQKKKKSEI